MADESISYNKYNIDMARIEQLKLRTQLAKRKIKWNGHIDNDIKVDENHIIPGKMLTQIWIHGESSDIRSWDISVACGVATYGIEEGKLEVWFADEKDPTGGWDAEHILAEVLRRREADIKQWETEDMFCADCRFQCNDNCERCPVCWMSYERNRWDMSASMRQMVSDAAWRVRKFKDSELRGMKVCICIKALYERYGNGNGNSIISCGYIQNEDDDCYDLYLNHHEALACMDGEMCEIRQHEEDRFTLYNNDGETGVVFTLTDEEFECATNMSVDTLI